MTTKRARVKKPWHRGTHQVAARKVTAQANARPGYRCPRCGLTLAQARRRWGPKTHWQGGHVIDGQIGGPLRAECSHCNASAGAAAGNRKRKRKPKRATPRRTELTW